METNFDQSVAALNRSSLPIDILQQITISLEQYNNESLSLFITQSFQSLLTLEQWAWQLLSYDSHQWINQSSYLELFRTLASFNKNLIFTYENIEIDTKASLLFPITSDQINNIFKQVEKSDDENDPFLSIISLWFDNHSYFLHDNPQYNQLSITDDINQYIISDYIMSQQYKIYLTQLRQPQLTPSVFTAKMLFYIKTCSFSFSSYWSANDDSFSNNADGMLRFLRDDYLEIVHIRSLNVESWSKELLTCMAHLISIIAGCCWWNDQKTTRLKILFLTEQEMCNHVQDLIRIVAHTSFQKQIKPRRSNDETTVIDACLLIMIVIAQSQSINWFFRSSTTIQNILLTVAEASLFDEICLCAYAVLGEVLTDEELKALKIIDTIGGFFFNMLEQAWYHSTKKYKQIQMAHLLRGFLNLSKNDFIQQRTADLNKVPLLIEMCDLCPSVYDNLWALSFNHDIQQQLRSSSAFMSKLSHLSKDCDNEQIRKTTHGILWNLEINYENRPTSEIKYEKTFDIMISYSHKEKVVCKQLYDELTKVGYRVWIDFDQVHGNIMDAMAFAIERSQTVIICMSEQYRASNYCRAEAHYAFQRQRKLVPVLLQKHYKPDGWLLFLISQLLYVDFTKHEFPRATELLANELKTERLLDVDVSNVRPKPNIGTVLPITSASSSLQGPQNILEWSKLHVHDWLIDHNLIEMTRLLANCDGRSLVYLNKHMKHGDPQQILRLLQADSLRRTGQDLSLIELSTLRSLIDTEARLVRSIVSTRLPRVHMNSNKQDS